MHCWQFESLASRSQQSNLEWRSDQLTILNNKYLPGTSLISLSLTSIPSRLQTFRKSFFAYVNFALSAHSRRSNFAQSAFFDLRVTSVFSALSDFSRTSTRTQLAFSGISGTAAALAAPARRQQLRLHSTPLGEAAARRRSYNSSVHASAAAAASTKWLQYQQQPGQETQSNC